MLFHFSEEHQMLMEMVREFTTNELVPLDKEMDRNGPHPEVFQKLAELGLMGLTAPAAYGGSACDTLASSIVLHEIAKGSGSIALTMDGQYMVTEMLAEYGSKEQKERFLPLGVHGELYAFALTEPGGGSDAGNLKTTAIFDIQSNEWIINGAKSWITNAPSASLMILMAQTDPGKGTKGISAFIVPFDTPGVTVGKHEEKLGMRGSDTAEVFLDDVRLPKNALLGERGKGFIYAMKCLDGARISVAAICAGLAEHAMELAKNYANQRVAFGQPIAEFQGISFKFADMATKLYASRLMFLHAAELRDMGLPYTMEAAEAKLFCSEAASSICNDCIQVFGGYGYSMEFDVQRLWRDVRILEIGEGTSEILRNLIGSKVLNAK